MWMQGFAWLGKIFFGLALGFSGSSSPGIYDRVTEVVLYIAICLACIPTHLVIQHLDDVVGGSPGGFGMVDKFLETSKKYACH